MSKCRLDHLVIAARTLEEGVHFVHEKFSVDIPKGGEHHNMATHNHVMQLGNDTFLEVIAVAPELEGNPDYVARPRWFGLDEPACQASIRDQPRLIAWVVNTDDLESVSSECSYSLGTVTPVSRGELNWLFALPSDGRLLAGGALPYVMQWQTQSHPSQKMADLGVKLKSLTIAHLYPDWLAQQLDQLGVSHLVNVLKAEDSAGCGLTATFDLPSATVSGSAELVLSSAS